MAGKEKSNLQAALDQIEETANKLGFGMFEVNFDDEQTRGDVHLIPCSRVGLPLPPHLAISECLCNPKLMRENPIRIFMHNKISEW